MKFDSLKTPKQIIPIDVAHPRILLIDTMKSSNKTFLHKVILATIRGSMNRVENMAPQMSAYVLKRAILVFYAKFKLYPAGLCSAIPAVDDWALKSGSTLKKLVPGGQRIVNGLEYIVLWQTILSAVEIVQFPSLCGENICTILQTKNYNCAMHFYFFTWMNRGGCIYL